MKFHLTLKSSNSKTGPIPVSTSPEETCPPSCPLKGKGCYADGGPLRIHWQKVTDGERGMTYDDFCNYIKGLPDGQLWRHNQCGDLVPKLKTISGVHKVIDEDSRDAIDKSMLGQLVNANRGKRGFTYTHYDVLSPGYTGDWNRDAINKANQGGFTINLSADSIIEADRKMDLGIAPVTTLLPEDADRTIVTPKGRKIIICPVAAEKLDSCAVCGLCAKQRQAIIGFPAHGAKKKQLSRFLQILE